VSLGPVDGYRELTGWGVCCSGQAGAPYRIAEAGAADAEEGDAGAVIECDQRAGRAVVACVDDGLDHRVVDGVDRTVDLAEIGYDRAGHAD
jgi:hypothetical protein